ncbi:MAG: hypothetical protein JRH20_25765, partial [Deltaproteobacteria bacterium]|nr:hypothetical protein [Deltaproteobacteria bacterium]
AQIAKLAMERHREARHLQSDLTQEAMHWYELALSSWSAPARMSNLRYYYADLLYEEGGCGRAAATYARVAHDLSGRFQKAAGEELNFCVAQMTLDGL